MNPFADGTQGQLRRPVHHLARERVRGVQRHRLACGSEAGSYARLIDFVLERRVPTSAAQLLAATSAQPPPCAHFRAHKPPFSLHFKPLFRFPKGAPGSC